ncbi:MAG: hypothetical protein J6T48_08800 [Bacteroidales bacterium]|nr:hypothetical protein [Bacteroidales bacterium]
MKLPLIISPFIICLLALSSCSNNKNLITSNIATTEVTTLCSELGESDNAFFRAIANATSSNINLSRDKAINQARTQLAQKIIDNTKSAATKYSSKGKNTDIKIFESVANDAIEMLLKDLSPTCEKYSETNGRYTTYIAVEIERTKALEKINSLLTNRIQGFNAEIFAKFFNE